MDQCHLEPIGKCNHLYSEIIEVKCNTECKLKLHKQCFRGAKTKANEESIECPTPDCWGQVYFEKKKAPEIKPIDPPKMPFIKTAPAVASAVQSARPSSPELSLEEIEDENSESTRDHKKHHHTRRRKTFAELEQERDRKALLAKNREVKTVVPPVTKPAEKGKTVKQAAIKEKKPFPSPIHRNENAGHIVYRDEKLSPALERSASRIDHDREVERSKAVEWINQDSKEAKIQEHMKTLSLTYEEALAYHNAINDQPQPLSISGSSYNLRGQWKKPFSSSIAAPSSQTFAVSSPIAEISPPMKTSASSGPSITPPISVSSTPVSGAPKVPTLNSDSMNIAVHELPDGSIQASITFQISDADMVPPILTKMIRIVQNRGGASQSTLVSPGSSLSSPFSQPSPNDVAARSLFSSQPYSLF